jgi:hypothetical protein
MATMAGKDRRYGAPSKEGVEMIKSAMQPIPRHPKKREKGSLH